MKSAHDSLLSVYRSAAADTRWDAQDIAPYWSAAVGRELARRTRPVRLYDGRLAVEVDGAEWREQLFPLTARILAKLNKLLGDMPIDRIDYRLAPPPRRPLGRAYAAMAHAQSLDEATGIADPQLRRLYRASMKRSR